VYTDTAVGGSFRRFGNLQMRFALESLIDMIAEAIGMEPMDIRLNNAIQAPLLEMVVDFYCLTYKAGFSILLTVRGKGLPA
jgi:xanthine dehydrogenase molybdenum-binding subunit